MPGSSEFNAMDSGMRRNDGLIRGSLENSRDNAMLKSGIRYIQKAPACRGSGGDDFYSVQQKDQIMTIRKVVVAVLVAGLAVVGLSACEKEGPAEKAGKAIDEAASDMSDNTKEAMEDIEKKVKE
jgi:hypothetical protein